MMSSTHRTKYRVSLRVFKKARLIRQERCKTQTRQHGKYLFTPYSRALRAARYGGESPASTSFRGAKFLIPLAGAKALWKKNVKLDIYGRIEEGSLHVQLRKDTTRGRSNS